MILIGISLNWLLSSSNLETEKGFSGQIFYNRKKLTLVYFSTMGWCTHASKFFEDFLITRIYLLRNRFSFLRRMSDARPYNIQHVRFRAKSPVRARTYAHTHAPTIRIPCRESLHLLRLRAEQNSQAVCNEMAQRIDVRVGAMQLRNVWCRTAMKLANAATDATQ